MPADDGGVEAVAYDVAPSTRTVLPQHAHRRRSARDAVLPLVLGLELLAGVAYGALHAPAPQDRAVALPSLRQVAAFGVPALAAPAALRRAVVPAAVPVQGPVVPRWAVLGPVTPAWVVAEPVPEPAESSLPPAAVRTGRNPFVPLTR